MHRGACTLACSLGHASGFLLLGRAGPTLRWHGLSNSREDAARGTLPLYRVLSCVCAEPGCVVIGVGTDTRGAFVCVVAVFTQQHLRFTTTTFKAAVPASGVPGAGRVLWTPLAGE